ncbi:MAG: metalloregulator ArsR/SmtB family transcription factor [Pseudobdellovibrionaceae bacterium]|jgi:DNA-binding transcriptional ArsR family regulator
MKKNAISKKELDEFEAVFFALSHPTRRQILFSLSQRNGSMIGGEIAKQFSCAWPTITGHLQNLENAGLVTANKKGREQLYQINTGRLDVIENWIDKIRGKS